jgi:hypothetical protein
MDVPQFLIGDQLLGIGRHGTRWFSDVADQAIGIHRDGCNPSPIPYTINH